MDVFSYCEVNSSVPSLLAGSDAWLIIKSAMKPTNAPKSHLKYNSKAAQFKVSDGKHQAAKLGCTNVCMTLQTA